MPQNLQLDANLDATDQVVKDQSGGPSLLTLSTQRVTIQSNNPSTEAVLCVANPGDGNALLMLGTARAWVFKQTGSSASAALELTAANPNNNNKNFIINTDGHVGIGTQTPQAKLDVNGSIAVSDDIILVGGDCAEEFEIQDDSETEPGTVMVIESDQRLRHSSQAYDHRVAGILAGAGNIKPGIILGRRANTDRRFPIALSGTTYCRVDASIHPINIGDMLTSSYRPGFAMKAMDRERSFGAVLGKALSGLTDGVGLVPVLVSLQ
jgi:hypothetical protein